MDIFCVRTLGISSVSHPRPLFRSGFRTWLFGRLAVKRGNHDAPDAGLPVGSKAAMYSVCMHACAYVCLCICTYACMCICTHVHMHVCMSSVCHIRMHACTHVSVMCRGVCVCVAVCVCLFIWMCRSLSLSLCVSECVYAYVCIYGTCAFIYIYMVPPPPPQKPTNVIICFFCCKVLLLDLKAYQFICFFCCKVLLLELPLKFDGLSVFLRTLCRLWALRKHFSREGTNLLGLDSRSSREGTKKTKKTNLPGLFRLGGQRFLEDCYFFVFLVPSRGWAP